jgi:hypothetical protein
MPLVLFTASSAPYNKGETAGFSQERCDALVKAGLAKHTDKPVRRPATRKVLNTTVLVEFVRSSAPYAVGETAGFSPAQATALVKSGRAERVEGERLKALQARANVPKSPPPVPQKHNRKR